MSINLVQVLFQIINFSILLLVMKKYIYKPLLNILEQRSKKIEAGLQAAEKSIEEQEKFEKKQKRLMVDAEKNAVQVIEAARQRAIKVEKQLAEEAKISIDKKLKKTEAVSKTRVKELEAALETRFNEAVLNTTEALLKNSLNSKLQKEIIKNHIQELKKVKFA